MAFSKLVPAAVLLLLTTLLLSSSRPASARQIQGRKPSGDKEFCTIQGGTVADYVLYNGNPPDFQPVGVQISKAMPTCSFPNEEGSNVYAVPLHTLVSVEPTLAVLAFQARVLYAPLDASASANPASTYCTQLGGAGAADTPSSYLPIPTAQAGWWTLQPDGTWYGVSDFCTFPDGSAVDTWTLFYHAATNNSANGIEFKYNSSPTGPQN